MGSLGAWEILLILLVVLLVFGAKRIPELARGLGKGIREFKDATNDIKQEFDVNRVEPPRQVGPPQQNYQQQAQQPYQQPQAQQPYAQPQQQPYTPPPAQPAPPAAPLPSDPPPAQSA